MRTKQIDAVAFYSGTALAFHKSYATDSNRLERLSVWRCHLKKYAQPVHLAYDIGCGSGMLTCEIAPLAAQVIGIDGASGMLTLAKKYLTERGVSNVSFVESRLPISDTSELSPAGLLISSSVIEYLDNIEEALLFMKSLLLPGGIIIFSISNRNSISRKLVRFVYRLTGRPKYFGFIRHFIGERDVQRLLNEAGLEYLTHTYFGGRDWVNRILGSVFPARLATNMILVVARRDQ